MRRTYEAYDEWFEDTAAAAHYREAAGSSRLGLVRTPDVRVEIVSPADFSGAQTVADRLREDAVVLVDLRGLDARLAGRLTDFCSGLAYALDSGLQTVADGVLLLTPDHVDVSGNEGSGVRPPGFLNRV